MQTGYKDIMSYVDQAFNGLEAVQSVKKAYHEGYSYAIIFMDASMLFQTKARTPGRAGARVDAYIYIYI